MCLPCRFKQAVLVRHSDLLDTKAGMLLWRGVLGVSFLGVEAQRDSLTVTWYHTGVLSLPEASLRTGCVGS